jgi:RHS repeat-associated protein
MNYYSTHSDHSTARFRNALNTGLVLSYFITDLNGDPIQHLQYLPFGEDFVNQNNNQYDTRFKFTGKEKDEETNYTYFGARYYDSDVSVWLSVDPMSDAFPSISSYAYCYNNPLNYNDAWGLYVSLRQTASCELG